MRIVITVEVEVERVEGKFESREVLEAMVLDEILGANPGDVEGENGGRYEVTTWDANAEDIKAKWNANAAAPAAPKKTPVAAADSPAHCDTCDTTRLNAFPTDRHGERVFGKCRACTKAGK